jgi:hypothetical protein
MQIRKLYQPEHYPGSLALPIFNRFFGPATDSNKSRRNVCVFAFEPNLINSAALREIDERYSRAGYPLVVFTGVAAGNYTGDAVFYRDGKETRREKHEWGASLIQW